MTQKGYLNGGKTHIWILWRGTCWSTVYERQTVDVHSVYPWKGYTPICHRKKLGQTYVRRHERDHSWLLEMLMGRLLGRMA